MACLSQGPDLHQKEKSFLYKFTSSACRIASPKPTYIPFAPPAHQHQYPQARLLLAQVSPQRQMKSFRKELWFNVPTRRAFVNITPQVETCLRESGIKEGFILVFTMHVTASVFINDDESGLHQDYDRRLSTWRVRGVSSGFSSTWGYPCRGCYTGLRSKVIRWRRYGASWLHFHRMTMIW